MVMRLTTDVACTVNPAIREQVSRDSELVSYKLDGKDIIFLLIESVQKIVFVVIYEHLSENVSCKANVCMTNKVLLD